MLRRGLIMHPSAEEALDHAGARELSRMTRRVTVFTIPNQNLGKEMPP